ncbi:hypothetical protein CP8484711_0429, partial [Chlamydia psittaci 84-8471/1]
KPKMAPPEPLITGGASCGCCLATSAEA